MAMTDSASRIAGNAMSASITRMMTVSARGTKPATSPGTTPRTAVTVRTAAPTRSESRIPWTTRAKRSRPKSSVPNQWRRDGGARVARTSRAVGSVVTIVGSTTASATTASTIAPPAIARRCRPRRRHTTAPDAGAMSATPRAASAIPDLGIQIGVEHVYDEVDQDDDGGDQQEAALDQRVVPTLYCHDYQVPQPRQVEHGLDDERSTEEDHGHAADDGQHVDQRVP